MHFMPPKSLCPSLQQGLRLGGQGTEDHFPTRAGQRAWRDASESPTTCQADAGGTGCFPIPTSPRLMRHCGNARWGTEPLSMAPGLLCSHEEGPLGPVGITDCQSWTEP